MTATKDLTPQEREEYWRMVNEDFVSSGMTRKEYCSKNDIPMSTLRYWQQRIKEKDDISQTENNRFVELDLLFSLLAVGSPLPLSQALFHFFPGFFHCQVTEVELLSCHYGIYLVFGLEGLFRYCKQGVGIYCKVNADDVVVVEVLIEQDVYDARILVGKAVVILPPNVGGEQKVE